MLTRTTASSAAEWEAFDGFRPLCMRARTEGEGWRTRGHLRSSPPRPARSTCYMCRYERDVEPVLHSSWCLKTGRSRASRFARGTAAGTRRMVRASFTWRSPRLPASLAAGVQQSREEMGRHALRRESRRSSRSRRRRCPTPNVTADARVYAAESNGTLSRFRLLRTEVAA